MQKSHCLFRASHIGCALLLIAITFGLYGTSLRNSFVDWDDGYLITDNVNIRSITPLTIQHIFTTYDPELYIPLTFLSYQIDYLFWGLNPMGFHLTNIALHTLNAILVFWLITLLRIPSPIGERNHRHYLVALTTALLWAVHPLNTEAVAWVSARKDLLSGFFFLCTLMLYLRSRTQRDASYFLRLTSYVSFLFGLLAKVSIAPLPIILLLIDWWQGRRMDRGTISEKTPYVLLSIVFGIVAILGKMRNVASASFLESLLLGPKSTVFYLQKLLFPFHLSALYPYTDSLSFGNIGLLFPLFLTIGLLTIAWISRRSFPVSFFALAWYVLLLLPSLTTFRKGDDIQLDLYFASDRYAYLPSIGILFLIISLGASFCARARTHRTEVQRQKIVIGLVSAGVVFLGFLSFDQSQTWENTETLFQNVIRSYPNSHIAHNNLGLFQQGRGDSAGAIEHYRKAIAIRPRGRTYYNLGLTYITQGEREQALEANRTAIQLNPRHARAHLNLGGLLLEDGKIPEAIQELNAALSLNPELALAHFNLGLAYERLGKFPMAEAAYTASLEKDPNDIETLVSLATLFVRKRQLDDALLLLQHAISLQPHHPRYESLLLEITRLQGEHLAL